MAYGFSDLPDNRFHRSSVLRPFFHLRGMMLAMCPVDIDETDLGEYKPTPNSIEVVISRFSGNGAPASSPPLGQPVWKRFCGWGWYCPAYGQLGDIKVRRLCKL